MAGVGWSPLRCAIWLYLIAGGSATAVGTLFGAVLLVLIIVIMQIGRLPPGSQDIVQGVVIILVLAIAGPGRRR